MNKLKLILLSIVVLVGMVVNANAQGITPGGASATVNLEGAEISVGAQPADAPHFVQCSDGAIAAPCIVSGTITAELSATDNAVLDAIAASVAAIVMYDEDFAYTDALKLMLGGCVYQDTVGPFTTDGLIGPLQCDANGSLMISGSVGVTSIADPVTVTGTVNIGNGSLTITEDGDIPADGLNVAEVAAVEYRSNGTTRVGLFADPCQANAKEPFTVNGTANAQAITGTASKQVHLCNVVVFSETEQDINLVSGTGTTCGTGTTAIPGLFGGTTAAVGLPALAKGGIVIGDGGYYVARAANDADNVCVFISGTGQYTVSGTYVVQ